MKQNRNTTTKGYCAVFTFAVSRAVHLTLVQDLSAQAFLQAVERFVNFRGAPSVIVISDNAACFRWPVIINVLNLKLDQTQIKERTLSMSQGPVEAWTTGRNSSPRGRLAHGPGGQKSYEAPGEGRSSYLCRMGDCVLSNIRPHQQSSFDCDVVVPSRPSPMTPNHFLMGRGDLTCPDIPCKEYRGDLRKRRLRTCSGADGWSAPTN